jgi:hypothetical protein
LAHVYPGYQRGGQINREARTIFFGIKLPFNSFYEYDLNKKDRSENPLFNFTTLDAYLKALEILDFSLTPYNQDSLIVTGGSKVSLSEIINFEIDQSTHELRFKVKCLPELCSKRFNHSAFVVNDYLFTVFGKNSEFMYNCKKADFLNLKAKGKTQFAEIDVINTAGKLKDPNFDNVIMFEPSAEEQKRCFDKGFSKMYFFGG